MKKGLVKGTSIVLAIAMVLTSAVALTGCGKEEVVEEDVTTTISVTSDELAPEITDEDLGITRKDPQELSKIVGYQSWEGYNFLIFRNEAGEGSVDTTVQIEDEDLFNSLYNARLYVYTDVSYSSVSQDDPMYSAYAKGLRSLGTDFYNLANGEEDIEIGESEIDESVADDTEEDSAEVVSEGNTDEAIETESTDETATENTATETDTEVSEETVEENTDEAEVNPDDIDLDGIAFETMSVEEAMNGGWQDTEASIEAEKARNELQNAIDEYMKSVSLNRATQILVYALDGELLGEMTSAKIDDYVNAFDVAATSYESSETGTVYVSDLDDGIEYLVEGLSVSEDGRRQYLIKNDSQKPVVIYAISDTTENTEVIFENYMQTAKSQGWYLVENQYKFESSDDSFKIRVEHKNSDADLAASLNEKDVLTISNLSDKVESVPSNYLAIVNNTDETLYVVADTGDTLELGSKQAIGVHRSAYSTLNYYFEGADGVNELLGISDEEDSVSDAE